MLIEVTALGNSFVETFLSRPVGNVQKFAFQSTGEDYLSAKLGCEHLFLAVWQVSKWYTVRLNRFLMQEYEFDGLVYSQK